MNTKEAFNKLTELNNIQWTPDLIQDVTDSWKDTVKRLHKELIGRKQSDFDRAWRNLVNKGFENELKEARKPFETEVNKRYQDQKTTKESIENQLKEFAKSYNPKKQENMICVKTSSASYFRTQGFCACKYAREYLNGDQKLLELLGFETEVNEVNRHSSGGQYPVGLADYELWANISAFDFAMLKLSGEFISVLNWAVLCWQKGTNPRVYFQFLSQDDYDKSQVLAYHTDYEVNVDNMRLELSWNDINALRKS